MQAHEHTRVDVHTSDGRLVHTYTLPVLIRDATLSESSSAPPPAPSDEDEEVTFDVRSFDDLIMGLRRVKPNTYATFEVWCDHIQDWTSKHRLWVLETALRKVRKPEFFRFKLWEFSIDKHGMMFDVLLNCLPRICTGFAFINSRINGEALTRLGAALTKLTYFQIIKIESEDCLEESLGRVLARFGESLTHLAIKFCSDWEYQTLLPYFSQLKNLQFVSIEFNGFSVDNFVQLCHVTGECGNLTCFKFAQGGELAGDLQQANLMMNALSGMIKKTHRLRELHFEQVFDEFYPTASAWPEFTLALQSVPLDWLCLNYNTICDQGAAELGKFIASSQTLANIELNRCYIESPGAHALFAGGRKNSSLQSFSFDDNIVTDTSAIRKFILVNPYIEFKLSGINDDLEQAKVVYLANELKRSRLIEAIVVLLHAWNQGRNRVEDGWGFLKILDLDLIRYCYGFLPYDE